jgi:hypothetical protein
MAARRAPLTFSCGTSATGNDVRQASRSSPALQQLFRQTICFQQIDFREQLLVHHIAPPARRDAVSRRDSPRAAMVLKSFLVILNGSIIFMLSPISISPRQVTEISVGGAPNRLCEVLNSLIELALANEKTTARGVWLNRAKAGPDRFCVILRGTCKFHLLGPPGRQKQKGEEMF